MNGDDPLHFDLSGFDIHQDLGHVRSKTYNLLKSFRSIRQFGVWIVHGKETAGLHG